MRSYIVTIRSVRYVDIEVQATSTVDALRQVRAYSPDLAMTDYPFKDDTLVPATAIRVRAAR